MLFFKKPIKFQWALALGINIPIIILLVIMVYFSTKLFEKMMLEDVTKVRLERNYKFTLFSLIQGHASMPLNAYKIIKAEYYKEFPYITIYRSKAIDELFGSERSIQIKNNNIEEVFKTGKEKIIINQEKKVVWGYFPIKSNISCTVCHYNTSEDAILGVILIEIPLKGLFEVINKTRIHLIIFGFFSVIIIVVVLYVIYNKIGHKNIEKISISLNKITEGDLLFHIDSKLLNRDDIIGELAKNLKTLQDYLTNFTAKLLDFSLKLTKQVDKVYHAVDFAHSNIKNLNINLDKLEMKSDGLFRLVNEISRSLIKFNETMRNFEKSFSQNLESENINQQLKDHFNRIETINAEIVKLIEKLEQTIKQEDEFFEQINIIKDIITNFNELLSQINQFVYESLIISTYLKNLVASIKIEGYEERLFDIFETDLDRYLLRIESHLMDIEKLDPTRWGDPHSISLGKWLESEEYKAFKNYVKDFEFDEFEKNYKELFKLGRDIIIAYDREDYLRVDKNLKEFRALYLLLKSNLTEMKSLYLEFKAHSA